MKLFQSRKCAGGAVIALLMVCAIVVLVIYFASKQGGVAARIDPRAMVANASIEAPSVPEVQAAPADQEEKAYRDSQFHPPATSNPILSKVAQMVNRAPDDEQP